jgi:hypothetical protein
MMDDPECENTQIQRASSTSLSSTSYRLVLPAADAGAVG